MKHQRSVIRNQKKSACLRISNLLLISSIGLVCLRGYADQCPQTFQCLGKNGTNCQPPNGWRVEGNCSSPFGPCSAHFQPIFYQVSIMMRGGEANCLYHGAGSRDEEMVLLSSGSYCSPSRKRSSAKWRFGPGTGTSEAVECKSAQANQCIFTLGR